MSAQELTIIQAKPRGFCAGVERAIAIVEKALAQYGSPVYVRHEIVHNRYVMETLERKGAVFVEELDVVPDDGIVIFSAHGVPKGVPAEAQRRKLNYLDATCPLVSKVHREAERHFANGKFIVLIGHIGHPEVIGTMGQLPEGAVALVENIDQVSKLEVADPSNIAFITQTTLSLDDTKDIIACLQERFPAITLPKKEDICYATTNRQHAVKAIAAQCDAMIVVGAPNSSNSMRLVEVAKNQGCSKSMLVQRATDIDWNWMTGVERLGLTAGASAPEELVYEVIKACQAHFTIHLEEVVVTHESVHFKLPKSLANA